MLKRLFQKLRGAQPTQLPGYTPMGVVREGSMASIFKARDQKTGRLVAVKVHKPGARKAVDKLESQYRDFTEGQITAAFDHPNIVKCYDHGKLGDTPYLVLEYIDGVTLASLMGGDSKRFDGHRMSFVLQAASALAHVHSRGFVHHDFCPKNLFVTTGNQIKLIDFGLATPLLDKPTLGARMGTIETLAPEVLRREPSDFRVDVYAWGVVAYQVLSGHWPFESPEHHQTLSKILNVNPVPLDRRMPDLAEDVANLVMRAIEKAPDRRLTSMTTAISVLERFENAGL